MLRLVAAAVAALGFLGSIGVAFAADDYYYDGYGERYVPQVVVPARRPDLYRGPPIVQAPYAPPVYGWVILRPSSCGEYRYWNGVRCVDARYRPPYVGPRW